MEYRIKDYASGSKKMETEVITCFICDYKFLE